MTADKKLLKRLRNKIIKNWNLPEDKFESLLDDLYPQISKSLFDDLNTLEFLIRYLDFYKSAFVSGSLKGETIDYESVFYDNKYKFLKKWLINTKAEIGTQFSFNLLKVNYEFKNWIIPEYQIDYIKNHINEIDNTLNNEDYLGEQENPAFHINTYYKNGDKPDNNKFDPQDISITRSLFLYKLFLKEQLEELESFANPIKTFQIQGNLSSKENEDGNLIVTFPVRQIIELVKKEMKNESPKETTTEKKGELKYYTTKQVSEMLQVSPQTLSQWREDGIIAFRRLGNKQIRYTEQDIQNAAKKIKVIPFS